MSTGSTVIQPGQQLDIDTQDSKSTGSEKKQAADDGRRAAPLLTLERRQWVILILAIASGSWIWNISPLGTMHANGMHFLATMVVAVVIWFLDVFEDYIVGFMLLLSWVVLGIVPSKLALAGFSENSWFFIIGALGIAAGIAQTPLLQRLALTFLRWIPIDCQKTYSLLLLSGGVVSGPLLPTGKARAAVAVPISQAISEAAGFQPRSNGSAAVSLSAFIGFSQMSFMFLNGAQCLIAWNFLPPHLKAEFGWFSWFLAAFPAAVVITLFMFVSVHYLLPVSQHERYRLWARADRFKDKNLGPISRREWITLWTLTFTISGWMTQSWHGINEAWVALAALVVFLLTGVLDKGSFKNNLDWGLILFFGVLNSMAVVASHLKVDAWFTQVSGPFLVGLADDPLKFLLAVFVLVAVVRIVLHKTPSAAFFAITLIPVSLTVGIHPGVLLVAVIMAGECFLLGYQDGPYQIALAGSGGSAFSHGQARKILAAKYVATALAIAISVPYWKLLGSVR
jgi:anion transporter